MPAAEDLEPYLAPTWFIDCGTPGVRHRAEEVAAGATSDGERERFGVRPLEFDGHGDALFHEYSADGRRHMEYVGERGSFADLPFEEIMRAFATCYGHISAGAGRDRDELFDPPGEAPAPGT